MASEEGPVPAPAPAHGGIKTPVRRGRPSSADPRLRSPSAVSRDFYAEPMSRTKARPSSARVRPERHMEYDPAVAARRRAAGRKRDLVREASWNRRATVTRSVHNPNGKRRGHANLRFGPCDRPADTDAPSTPCRRTALPLQCTRAPAFTLAAWIKSRCPNAASSTPSPSSLRALRYRGAMRRAR